NYMLWRELFLPVFKGHGVYGFIDGSIPCPEPSISRDNGTSVSNPAFEQWVQLDSIVLSWIHATISQEILQAIIKPHHTLTARDACLQIECLFRDQVSSRTLQLKVQFHNLKKGDLSINEYVHRLKSIADALTSIGNLVSDSDLVLQILSGLPPEYMSVSTSISTRIPLPTFVETRSLLFLHEAQLSSISRPSTDNSTTAFVAKQQSFSSNGRGRGPPPFSSQAPLFSSPTTHGILSCQLCYQPYRTARDCPSLGSKAFVSDVHSNPSFSSHASPGDASWFVDSGTSSHLTPNASILSSIHPYNGFDRVTMGNGTQLTISYTGHGTLSTPYSVFSLMDILIVPHLSANLLSVRKFISDNICSIEFDPLSLSIKE
ncbi:retrovirus-related pol polyprotein from transposon tnt 1-94, partial [Nicotiana attenuata]